MIDVDLDKMIKINYADKIAQIKNSIKKNGEEDFFSPWGKSLLSNPSCCQK